jgi:hypothetical protein
VSYEYATVPARLMRDGFTLVLENDAFVSEQAHVEKVKRLLSDGFRWVRTEDDVAILERETSK